MSWLGAASAKLRCVTAADRTDMNSSSSFREGRRICRPDGQIGPRGGQESLALHPHFLSRPEQRRRRRSRYDSLRDLSLAWLTARQCRSILTPWSRFCWYGRPCVAEATSCCSRRRNLGPLAPRLAWSSSCRTACSKSSACSPRKTCVLPAASSRHLAVVVHWYRMVSRRQLACGNWS